LPNISAPSAAQIAQESNPSPAAKALLTPQQTPSQYLGKLQEQHQGAEMVKTMAHGMSDQHGVSWASKSAEKVSDKLPPHEVHAMKTAQAWSKNPTPENQKAAALAAEQGGCKGPGSLAAQGAAWANPAPGAPRLAPHAVSGAVLMSAAIQANPKVAPPALNAPTMATPSAPEMPTLQTPQVAAPQANPPSVPAAVQQKTFQEQHPFIALGLDIASGKTA
jgi:hypothetical protein